jgi:hypothetical protein
MRLGSIEASPRILPLTASSVLLATGIKTAVATSASGVLYSGAAINGTTVTANIAYPSPSGLSGCAQYPIAVASNSAGSYVANSLIVFTGTRDGKPATSTATVVGTGGNATFVGDQPLESCSSVTIEAQANTSGQWTLGWNDIACPLRGGSLEPFRVLRPTSTGNVVVTCGSGHDATIPVVAGDPDEIVDITRVKFSSTSTTVTTLKLYE